MPAGPVGSRQFGLGFGPLPYEGDAEPQALQEAEACGGLPARERQSQVVYLLLSAGHGRARRVCGFRLVHFCGRGEATQRGLEKSWPSSPVRGSISPSG